MKISLLLSFITLIFLLTLSSFAGAYWVSLDGSPERAPDVNVLYSNNGEAVIEYKIYGFNVDEVNINGITYHKISLPGEVSETEDVGKAALPRIPRTLGIPDNANVSYTVLDLESKDTTGFLVFPAQEPKCISDTTDIFYIDTTFYDQNIFYPSLLVGLTEPGIVRTIHLVDCIGFPIEFNPYMKKIRTCTYLKVRLNFTGGISREKHITLGYSEFLEKLLVNYHFLNIYADLPDRRETGIEYLFITYYTYENKIQPLVEWYKMLGYVTKVKNYTYYPTCDEIKDYISNEYFYNSPPCLKYVMLVGNRYELPPFEYSGQYPTLSDSWFSFLEGNDLYAEIAIGRLADNVDRFVDHILEFETDPYWVESNWLDRVLLVAHWYQPFIDFLTTIKNTSYSNWSPSFCLLDGNNHDNDDVLYRINSGSQIVCYNGHGVENAWQAWSRKNYPAILYWTNGDIFNLDHGGRAPILFSLTCLNNHLQGCINAYWTSSIRTKAASAALGASNLLWEGIEDYGLWLFKGVGDNLYTIDLGGVHNAAVAEMLSMNQTIEAKANAKTLLLLGDPAMEVWTTTPVKFTVKNDFNGGGGKLKIGPVEVDSPWQVMVQKWGRRRYFKVETKSPQVHNNKTYYFHHWSDGHENSHYMLPITDDDETRIATLSIERFPAWEYLQPQSQWSEPKKYHGAASACGKICALFGHSQYSTHTNTCHIYNPINDEWIFTTRDPKRKYVAAVTLNKRIYILGGQLSSGSMLKRVDIYDPYNHNWDQGANMPGNKEKHAACVYQNKIYTMGGLDFLSNPDKKLYVFDPSSGWQEKAYMHVPRYNLASAAACGKIYAIGGIDDSGQNDKNCVEAYNPYENTWQQDQNHGGTIKPMPFELSIHSCTSVNGKIYVIGGSGKEIIMGGTPHAWTGYRAIVLEYDPIRNEWGWQTSIEQERAGLAVTSMPNFSQPVSPGGAWPAICENTIYVIGGAAKLPFTPYIEIANIPIEASPYAFGFHNGHILDTDASGRIHFVYVADNGWIYYTSSKDGILYEIPVEIGQGENPNLSVDSEDNIHLLWTKNSHICYKRINGNTGLLSEEVILWSPTSEYPKFGGPAIAVSQDSLFVVWEARQSGFFPPRGKALLFGSANIGNVSSTFHYSKLDEGRFAIPICVCQQPPGTVPDTILKCPSIDVDNIGNPYIVWDKARHFLDIVFYEKENGEWISNILSDTSECTQESEPNIKVENRVINVVWSENYDPCEPNDIYYRRGYVKGGWEPVRKVCSTDKPSRNPIWSNGYILWQEHGDIYRNSYDYSIFDFKGDLGENLTDLSGIPPEITFSAPRVVTVGKNVYEFFQMQDTTGNRICLNVEEMEESPPIHAVNLGSVEASPYTTERDGYIAYGENFFETVDFDSTKLVYHFDEIESHPQNKIELVLYHEGDNERKLRIRIDDGWTKNIWVSPGEPVVVNGMIPISCLKDGEIDVTIEPTPPTKDELAVCGALWIYDLSTSKGGGGTQFADNKDKTSPIIYSLKKSYPDPFNKNTTISYSIAKSGKVLIKVYDISGRVVKTIVNEEQSRGIYKVRWEGTDNHNCEVSAGVYFYRLQSGEFTSTKKTVCVR